MVFPTAAAARQDSSVTLQTLRIGSFYFYNQVIHSSPYCCIYKPPMTSSGVTNMSNFQSDSSIGTAVDCSCLRKLSPTISQKSI